MDRNNNRKLILAFLMLFAILAFLYMVDSEVMEN
jgi:hypothetical protein